MLLSSILLSALLSVSDLHDADAAAALALQSARLRAAESIAASGYASMRLLAVETGRPLVVGVGCEPPAGPWLTTRWDGFPTNGGLPCVIVSAQPKGGGDQLIWLATLPSGCQSSDVSRILSPPVAVQLPAVQYRPAPQWSGPAPAWCPGGT